MRKHPVIARAMAPHLQALLDWGVEAAPNEGGRPIIVKGREFGRWRLRGAGAGQFDILALQGEREGLDWLAPTLVEVSQRTGCYDGRERIRWLLRPAYAQHAEHVGYGPGTVDVRRIGGLGAPHVEAVISNDDGRWTSGPIRVYTTRTVDPDGAIRIVGWHAARYYTHLQRDAVQSAEQEFAAAVAVADTMSIGEANRLASRILYRVSRDAGWAKLTARERERLGLTYSDRQWWPRDAIEGIRMARAGLRRPDVGEYTLDAAAPAGLAWRGDE
jgi:hypothetical protein